MTSIRLSKNIEERLETLANITHRPKSFYIREAIEKYLEEFEDGYLALERISQPNRKLLSTDEMLKALNDDL